MANTEKRFSNKAGEEYDLFSLALPHQYEIQSKAVETLINHFTGADSIKVLEIGFGTGITSSELLSKDKDIHLTGIDSEPKMLKKALSKLQFFPKEQFELCTDEAYEYLKKQEDQSFNAIISVWVLHNLKRDFRNKIISEIFRVLKSGGIFVNGDKIAVTEPALHKEHLEWQLKKFDVFEETSRPDLKKEWTDHYIVDEDPERILYENEFIHPISIVGVKE